MLKYPENNIVQNRQHKTQRSNILSCIVLLSTIILSMAGYYLWTHQEQTESVAQTVKRPNVVGGIFHSEDSSSAVIGDRIVHEGDIVHGAVIIKIHINKVDFEKNGVIWSQKVQQGPGPEWSKTN